MFIPRRPPPGALCMVGDWRTRRLYTGGVDGYVRCWSSDDLRLITQWRAHVRPVSCLTLDPYRGVLISAGRDGVVREWDLAAPQALHRHPMVRAPQFENVANR